MSAASRPDVRDVRVAVHVHHRWGEREAAFLEDALDPAPFVCAASAASGAGRTGGAGRACVALRSREPGQPLKASDALWPCGTRRPRGAAQPLGSHWTWDALLALRALGPGDAARSREGQDDVSLAAPAALAWLDDTEPAVKIPLPVDADARMENSGILGAGRCCGAEHHPHHQGGCGWGESRENRRA